jgi:hypothetical protein
MSATNEWTEWHLTPKGWIRGSERTDHAGTVTRDPPIDRVITVTYSEYQAMIQHKARIDQEEDWRSDDASSIAALETQYGPAPRHL